MPNHRDFSRDFFSWLLSDRFKWIKICIPLATIFLLGFYYNRNLVQVINSREYVDNLFKNGTPFPICLNYSAIHHEDGTFFILLSGKKIELQNLSNIIKGDLNRKYSIQGEMVDCMILDVQEIRSIHPRKYKIILSGLTTLIVCTLFFLSFRYSKKGFVCK